MSTTDPISNGVAELDPETRLTLDMGLDEGEALRAWLLKASAEGATSLDDPAVNGVLAKLASALDAAHAAVNVRRELAQAGLNVTHLSDDEVRELGRRVSEASLPGVRG